MKNTLAGVKGRRGCRAAIRFIALNVSVTRSRKVKRARNSAGPTQTQTLCCCRKTSLGLSVAQRINLHKPSLRSKSVELAQVGLQVGLRRGQSFGAWHLFCQLAACGLLSTAIDLFWDSDSLTRHLNGTLWSLF